MDLESLTLAIKGLVRRYSKSPEDAKTLEEIARLSAFSTLESGENSPSEVLKHSEDSILRYIRDGPSGDLRSLKKTKNLRYLRPTNENLSQEDQLLKVKEIKEILRNHFGRTYIKNIKSNNPKYAGLVVRALIENVWNLSESEIPRKVNYQKFVDSNMENFLWAFYRNSPTKAVEDAYPNTFFPWEFGRVPINYWSGAEGFERAREAIRWLCNKYNYDGNGRIPLGYAEFEGQGLIRPLSIHFNNSTFLGLKSIFPHLKPWDAKAVKRGFYDSLENRLEALNSFLLENNFPIFTKLSPEEVYDSNPRTINRGRIEKFGLRGLIDRHNGSTYKLFKEIYPDSVYPWFFKGNKSTTEKDAAHAIRWLFDNYLRIKESEIPKYATNKLFWKMGYSGILTRRDLGLKSSPYRAVDLAYPKKFSPSDFYAHRKTASIQGLKDFRGSYKRKIKSPESSHSVQPE